MGCFICAELTPYWAVTGLVCAAFALVAFFLVRRTSLAGTIGMLFVLEAAWRFAAAGQGKTFIFDPWQRHQFFVLLGTSSAVYFSLQRKTVPYVAAAFRRRHVHHLAIAAALIPLAFELSVFTFADAGPFRDHLILVWQPILTYLLLGSSAVLGVVFFFFDWRRAPADSPSKHFARHALIAFLLHTLAVGILAFVSLYALVLAAPALFGAGALPEVIPRALLDSLYGVAFEVLAVAGAASVLVLAYGFLANGIHDEMRPGIRRDSIRALTVLGLAAGAFGALKLVELLSSQAIDPLLAAIVAGAGGALAPAIGPRVEKAVASLLAPESAPAPATRTRDMRTYFAALEEAWVDGPPTEREKRMLKALRRSLSIPAEEARRIERSLSDALARRTRERPAPEGSEAPAKRERARGAAARKRRS